MPELILEVAGHVLNSHTPCNVQKSEDRRRFITELLSKLYHVSQSWSSNSLSSLRTLISEFERCSPRSFFYFPGTDGSFLCLSPVKRWPQKNGWSFNCWLCVEGALEGPRYIYCFQDSDNIGLTAHLECGALVLTIIRNKGKGLQHRILLDLRNNKWYMFSVVYVYNRWGHGEVSCYLDGIQKSTTELSWYLRSNGLNRLSIGGSCTKGTSNSFCGRLTNIMGFTMALSPEQIRAIYSLGVDHESRLRFANEYPRDLSDQHRKFLYGGGQLYSSLMFAYFPSACDGNLCLNRAPKCPEVFAQNATHAVMQGQVQAISSTTIACVLHSLGGIQALYPLLEKLHLPLSPGEDDVQITPEAQPSSATPVAILFLNLMLTVARTSPSLGRQLVQTKGLQLFATALQSAACSAHLTTALLNCLIDVARELISVADLSHLDTYESGAQMHCSFVYPLLRHVYGYLFSNPDLWIRAPLEVQDQLYQFLATEFFSAMIRHGCVNRTSTVLQCVYNLKYYYALVDPVERSGFHLKTPDKRPLSNSIEVLKLRANFLIYLKQLMIRHGPFLDTEMQALLSYLLSVHEDENLHDVLYFLVTLALANPTSIAPTFIRNNGLCVLLRLFNSNDEANRIYALKLLGFYIHQVCLLKRENLVDRYHLFSLVTNMISQSSTHLSISTYNALFEVLIGKITPKSQPYPLSSIHPGVLIVNPGVVPVISTLLCRSKPTPESLLVKQLFLRHLLSLCLGNGGNRRSLLQLSVWQSYILRLSPCYPTTEYEANVLASVLRLLRCLVFHAIRYERDGWRVWLDTMALVCLWLDGTFLSDFDSLPIHSDKPCTSTDVKSHNRPSASPTDVGFDLTEIRTVGIIDDVATSAVPTSAPCVSTESDVMGAAVTSSVERVSLTSNDSTEDKHSLAPFYDPPSSDGLPPTRSPRIFRWSYLHQILLDDLLCSIEDELGFVSMRSVPHHYGDTIISIRSEKHGFVRDQGNVTPLVGQLIGVSLDATEPQVDSSENSAVNMLQDPANCVFLINLVNLLSDCTDVLVCGSGGLLPLLAAATSPSGDIGALDSVNGLSLSDAMSSVLRIAFLVDCCLLHVDLLEIERQRQMPCGTLARRFARLYLTAATRNCLEFRFFHLTPSHDLVLQLKSFSNFRDGVRYVPITPDACTLQSGMEPSDHPSGASPTHQPTKTTADANSPRTPPHTSSLLRIDSVGSDVESELDGMSQRLLCMTKLLCSAAGPSGSRLGFFPSPWRFVNFLSIDQLFWVLDLKQRYSAKVAHLPIQLQRLVYALRSTLLYPVVRDKSFLTSVLQPLSNSNLILQRRDLNRLQGILFRCEEVNKLAEPLVLAFVYFLSVLLVSRYRDLLEPEHALFGKLSTPAATSAAAESPEATTAGTEQSVEVNTSDATRHSDADSRSFRSYVADHVTQELTINLAPSASFLRELFTDFSSHLDKHLLNSQGQPLFSAGLVTARDDQSVVELVMLMCSQEWQTSLQKNAGLAFIELINEGRVSSRFTLEHILLVAQEAIALMDHFSTTHAKAHAEFQHFAAQLTSQMLEEARLCDHLIGSARRRDRISTALMNNKVHRILAHLWSNLSATDAHFPDFSLPSFDDEQMDLTDRDSYDSTFYKLDGWEDDSRCRRRLSLDPHGSSHRRTLLFNASRRPSLSKPCDQELETILKESGATSNDVQSLTDSESGSFVPIQSLSDSQSKSLSSIAKQDEEEDEEDLCLPGLQYELTLESADFYLTPEESVQFTVACTLVSFGIDLHGSLAVSKSTVQFERDPKQCLDRKLIVYVESTRNRWSFSEIQAIFRRSYLHQPVALELFVTSRTSVFFAFEDTATLERIVSVLPPVGIGSKYGLPRSRSATLSHPKTLFSQSNMTQRWQRREVSNFDYLMYLNTIAGRTYNDLNQYPIFPWILCNYTSNELDLNEPSNYRDLSKPIGALDPKRKAFFDERYARWEDDTQPPFHYGTHYSTSAFVLGYLLRLEPFTTLFLHLQGGEFDHPDRTFSSIGRTWENCQRNSSDVKELIPEFFYLPEMFENVNRLNLGIAENGEDVSVVKLPRWASTPEEFVRIHRQALESELVSCQLHHWIDLIFGYKQRGPEAVLATNVFHHLTYEGSVDWRKITDPVLLKAVQSQIQSFGQTPAQLLRAPHPHRNSPLHLDPLMFSPLGEEVCAVYKLHSNAPVVFAGSHTEPSVLPYPSILTVNASRTVVLSRWNSTAADDSYRKARVQPTVVSNLGTTALTAFPSSSSIIAADGLGSPPSDNGHRIGVVTSTGQHHDCEHIPTPESSKVPSYALHSVPLNGPKHPASDVTYPASNLAPLETPSFQIFQSTSHSLGDDFDLDVPAVSGQFVTTTDSRTVFVCGFDDCSFRLYSLESGRFIQSIFGHFEVVTCIARSEYQPGDHCYLVTGSRDRTVKLWVYNTRRALVIGDQRSSDVPSPLVTLVGHGAEITSVCISAELGLILSGSSAGTALLHTTRGELLRQLCTSFPENYMITVKGSHPVDLPIRFVSCHREGYLVIQFGAAYLTLYTLNGKVLHSSDLTKLAVTTVYQLSAVLFSACGRYLLISGTDGVVWVLRTHNLSPVHSFPRCDASVRCLCLTKDQRFLLVGLDSGSLVVFYVDFGQWHQEFQERY